MIGILLPPCLPWSVAEGARFPIHFDMDTERDFFVIRSCRRGVRTIGGESERIRISSSYLGDDFVDIVSDHLRIAARVTQWGPRLYLVPEAMQADFCNLVNNGGEPRTERFGEVPLRRGDENRSAAPTSAATWVQECTVSHSARWRVEEVRAAWSVGRVASLGESEIRFQTTASERVYLGMEGVVCYGESSAPYTVVAIGPPGAVVTVVAATRLPERFRDEQLVAFPPGVYGCPGAP